MAVRVYSPALPSVELFGAYEGIASATRANEIVSITFTPTEGNLTVVPYDGDYSIRYLQLEQGSIPTSYIPTSGSQGARAEDVLTIPDAPWPEAVTTGPELVTNGTFDTDASGWAAFSGATLAQVSGEMQITGISANTIQGAYQGFATEVGGVYKISVDLTGTLPANRYIRIGTSAGSANLVSLNQGTLVAGTTTVYFAATTTTTYISIAVFTTGQVLSTDNISVREISPRAIGISMKGLMTYADTDSFREVSFVRWSEAVDNEIELRLNTAGGFAGLVQFIQDSGSEIPLSKGSDSYSPGINVPFSMASYHKDNGINGAVDGVALTENTTPTILPDLSTTPIAIRPNGGPLYLEEMRIWVEGAVDKITDALTEEASAP